MAKTVDDRVVSMAFENGKFEANARQTMSTLDKLKQSLKFDNAQKGLQDIAAKSDKLKHSLHFGGATKGVQDLGVAMQRVDPSKLTTAAETAKASFSSLSVIAVTALATIANKAVTAGLDISKALTIQPVSGGLREYETKLNSVQTILANTQAAGTKLKDVNATLQELNEYSDKTIYNFGEMARNIGTFTAAGVDLETATGSIKGIANLAALSGSNSQQAATAMYQLSQAISAGRVSLQDWNSVVNAGMGGAVFQRALAQTAQQIGTLDEGAVKLTGKMKNVTIAGESFRQSISSKPGEQSWLTSEVLTKTLQQFTGDLSDAELAAMGFNDAQIRSIQATAKTAQEAATKVKTLSQLFSVAKETAESGWAETWQIIFGDFGEARKLFTGASEGLNSIIQGSAEARNKILGDWKALGGRTVLIRAISAAFEALRSVLKPIKDAFREIFPAKTGQDLYNLTWRLLEFTQALKIGPETADRLKRTFAGLFAILSIGKSIISGVVSVITRMLGVVGDGSGGFLEFTGSIGDFLVSLDKAIKNSSTFKAVFERLGDALAKPIQLLQKVASAIGDMFSGAGGAGATALEVVLGGIEIALNGVITLFNTLGDAISSALSGISFDNVLNVIQVGLLGGIVVLVKKFFNRLGDGIGGGLLDNMTGAFGQLTDTLKSMQQNVQADTLLKIAAAVGILAISVVALSNIDGDNLAKALTGLGVAFGQLLAAMAVLTKIAGAGGFLKVPFIAASLILLAAAIDLLVIAVYALSKLSWEELAKGLTGVAVLLATVSAASIPLSANSAGMIRAGIGIVAIALAMKVLASAVKDFGKMDWSTIGKGLAAVAASLVAIGLAMNFVPPSIILTGAGLVVVAAGLKLLVGVIKAFGNMDLSTAGKGLGIIVAAIVALGVAVMALPKTLVIQAAGLMLLSVAIASIAASVALMGALSLKTLAKGLGALAGALIILAAGLAAMSGSLSGAAALIVAAGALALLVPPLVLLGKQSIGTLVKGLVAMAGAFVILGVAGTLLAPLSPALLALGGALLVLGVAMLALGGGVALLGTGLAAIAVSGVAAIKVLIDGIVALVKLIPMLVKGLVTGLLLLVQGLAAQAPAFAAAMGKILISLINTVITAVPRLGQLFLTMITTALTVLRTAIPQMVTTGIAILTAFLQGVAQSIGKITTTAVTIIVNFLRALTSRLPELVSTGAKFLVELLKGIASKIGEITKKALDVVAKFLKGLASKLPDVIDAGADVIKVLLKGIARNIEDIATAAGSVIAKFVSGIGRGAGKVVTAATNTIIKFATELGRNGVKLATAAGKIILDFLNGIRAAVDTYTPQITEAGIGIGIALAQGVAEGILGAGMDMVRAAARQLASAIPGPVRKALGVNSPAKVMIPLGEAVGEGLALGMTNKKGAVVAVADAFAQNVIDAFAKRFKINKGSALIMEELGTFIGDGFAKGLTGSRADIDNAFLELNNQIVATVTKFKEEIATRKELRKAYFDQKKHTKAETQEFRAAGREMDAYNKKVNFLLTQRKSMLSANSQEVAALKKLSDSYTDLTNKLSDAQSALQTAISLRDNYSSSIFDKFSALPAIDTSEENKGKEFATYLTDLTTYYNDVVKYRQTLDQLRGAGLDDATYKMLLDQGVAGQNFADQLLQAGPGAIDQLRNLDTNLQEQARGLGSNAATSMFQAGVDAAQGLVNGLNDQINNPDPNKGILAAIEKMVTEMIKRVKKKLKIKSPSQVFSDLGEFSGLGFVDGLTATVKPINIAAGRLGDEALASLQKSMSSISTMLTADLEVNPVIRPVLDLSDVQASAKTLSDLTSGSVSLGSAAYEQAAAIAQAQSEQLAEMLDNTEPTKILNYEQNNYSPESLSAAEIYRQTQNQLSKAKAMLEAA